VVPPPSSNCWLTSTLHAQTWKSFQEQIAEADKVVTRWSVCGTHRGELLGVPPTGRPLSWTGITIHRLVGGRVMEERGEEDALGLMRQTGVMHDPILVSDAAFS